MSFGLPKDPWGFGVMMKEVLLDRGIKGGRFDGFSNQASDSINRVFV
jgi:hypothetical protein